MSTVWSTQGEYHWDTAARVAAAAVEWVAKPDAEARVLNINVPNRPYEEMLGVREAELAPAGEVWVASADVSQGDLKIEITGRADPAPGTDVASVHEGYVVGHAADEHRARPGHRRGRRHHRRAGLTPQGERTVNLW